MVPGPWDDQGEPVRGAGAQERGVGWGKRGPRGPGVLWGARRKQVRLEGGSRPGAEFRDQEAPSAPGGL